MATTTNYGWTTPDDTALVKDGASAIRTLGTSVDTTTKNLNPSTTLGDIEYRSSTANTNTRLGIGADGTVLTVASGVPTWAAAGGALTLSTIASGSFAATATLTLSSLSAYDTLILQLNNVTYGTAAAEIQARPNNTSSSVYYQYSGNFENQTSSNYLNTDRIKLQNTINASNSQQTNLILVLTNCKQAGFTNFYFETRCNSDGITGPVFATGAGVFESAAAISSLVVLNSGGYTFVTSSTYKLIGG